MPNIFEKIRIFSRSNAGIINFNYFVDVCSNGNIIDIKNTLQRVKYRGDHNETYLLDEKMIEIYDYIYKFDKKKRLNESMKEFIGLLVKYHPIMNIFYLLNKTKLLLVSDIIISLLFESVENNLKESVKTYIKFFFSLIYRTKMQKESLQMFFCIIRTILIRSIELENKEIVVYILILLGYNFHFENNNKDFEINNIYFFGKGIHTNSEIFWFKFNVHWKSEKLDDTPINYISEFVKNKIIVIDDRLLRTDDRYLPITNSISNKDIIETYFKVSSSNLIPQKVENCKLSNQISENNNSFIEGCLLLSFCCCFLNK